MKKVATLEPIDNGELIVKLTTNKEQRFALLESIVMNSAEYDCLKPLVEVLEKHVREENPDLYGFLCLKYKDKHMNDYGTVMEKMRKGR